MILLVVIKNDLVAIVWFAHRFNLFFVDRVDFIFIKFTMNFIRTKKIFVSLLVLLISVSAYAGERSFKIASFNIKSFGQAKLRHTTVVPLLIRIVHNFDVVAIQELRDKQQKTLPRFVELLNTGPYRWAGAAGERLGRGRYKEQFSFVFRSDKFSNAQLLQYPDPEKVFRRPPTGLTLSLKDTDFRFTVFNFHITPSEAIDEIPALTGVTDWLHQNNIKKYIFAGDFNADCSYYNKKDFLELQSSLRLWWISSSFTDTTLSANNCVYDHIGLSTSLMNFYHEGSGVHRFDVTEYTVSPYYPAATDQFNQYMQNAKTTYQRKGEQKELPLKLVSDHYPVWVELEIDKNL